MMNSRIVSISKFNKKDITDSVIPHADSEWITIQWFHPDEYQTQEQLNDASEIFADNLIKNTDIGQFVKVENSLRLEDTEGHLKGFKFELCYILEKTKL